MMWQNEIFWNFGIFFPVLSFVRNLESRPAVRSLWDLKAFWKTWEDMDIERQSLSSFCNTHITGVREYIENLFHFSLEKNNVDPNALPLLHIT